MRLWHKDLIDVLPRQQLLGQWRECCCIAKNIAMYGTPNHVLVNRILDYPLDDFVTYTVWVQGEMERRGYICDSGAFFKWINQRAGLRDFGEVFYDWHNEKYLQQCYFNLEEKYDCGGITDEEWGYICSRCNEIMEGYV